MHRRELPLHKKHVQLGAKFGVFGSWEVPLYYSSILEEHEAVRIRAGLFDISHMGEFFLEGAHAGAFLEELFPRDVVGLKEGRAIYGPLLNEKGGIVDDVIIYKLNPESFLLIVNATNIEKDQAWIRSRLPSGVEFHNASEQKGLLALQGPASAGLVGRLFGEDFSGLKYYQFRKWGSGIIARTGYTGEIGFEIMVDRDDLYEVWGTIFAGGKRDGLAVVGFGARDTLRLEAGMLLYGHDMTSETTPLEAGIDWAVDFNKERFMGREALLRQKAEGLRRRLVGFEVIERGIPRCDCEIRKSGRAIGKVTSGSFSPTLGKNIGLGYVEIAEAEVGNEVEIVIRERPFKASIVKLPFYHSSKA